MEQEETEGTESLGEGRERGKIMFGRIISDAGLMRTTAISMRDTNFTNSHESGVEQEATEGTENAGEGAARLGRSAFARCVVRKGGSTRTVRIADRKAEPTRATLPNPKAQAPTIEWLPSVR